MSRSLFEDAPTWADQSFADPATKLTAREQARTSLFEDVPDFAAPPEFVLPEGSLLPTEASLNPKPVVSTLSEPNHGHGADTYASYVSNHTSLFADNTARLRFPGLLAPPEQNPVSERQSLFVDPYAEKPPVGLPDDAPIVSIDTRLGKKYSQVDFDYDAYSRELDRQGMPPDAQPMSIAIKKRSIADRVLSRYLGVYRGGRRQIEVSVTKHADRTLKHEMQYGVDHSKGMLKGSNDLRYSVGLRAAKAFMPVTLGTISLYTAHLISTLYKHDPGLLDEARIVSTPLPIIVGGVAIWGYGMHPEERRAEKAADESPERILTLTKRHRWYKRIINRFTMSAVALSVGSFALNGDAPENNATKQSSHTQAAENFMPAFETIDQKSRMLSYKILSSIIEGEQNDHSSKKHKKSG